ncbi:ornithine cyclodeaminase family protein [Streptomyces eurythermus]|uniref:ornithine cyclodeaminase family protein n=1 Tax=Streptomyces eurythermus TaxID=42237 RepID=UPI00368CB763
MTAGTTSELLYLTREEVVACASRLDAVAVVREALLLHAQGRTTLPAEAYLPWETEHGHFARSLSLPGALWGESPAIGLKVINSSLGNPLHGRERAQGLTFLFDRETAHPLALMDAGHLSALRTAAYTVLSVRLLGVAAPRTVAVIGGGALGLAHVRLLARDLPTARFALYDLSPGRSAEASRTLGADGIDITVAESAESAVRGADVVVTATTTTEGYIPMKWIEPGALIAHVSLDDVLSDVVAEADLVVIDDWKLISEDDRRLLGRLYCTGELRGPAGEVYDPTRPLGRRVDATLSDVLLGLRPGRRDPGQIVLSNPFGMGILDVALAAEVYALAWRDGLGIRLPR